MTPQELLDGFSAVLPAPLAQMGVILSVHEDEDDAHELLCVGPELARLCLLIEDVVLSASEDDQDAGPARITVRALLQSPRDFQLPRAAGEITGGLNGNVSLLTLCSWVRCLIQRVLFPGRDDFDNTFGFRFLTERRYAPANVRGLRSRELRFQCFIGLDLPTGHPLEVPAA